jgi:hypothetical protein
MRRAGSGIVATFHKREGNRLKIVPFPGRSGGFIVAIVLLICKGLLLFLGTSLLGYTLLGQIVRLWGDPFSGIAGCVTAVFFLFAGVVGALFWPILRLLQILCLLQKNKDRYWWMREWWALLLFGILGIGLLLAGWFL